MVIIEVIIIIDRVSIRVWLILVIMVGMVSGSCILNSSWCGLVLNECDVLIRFVGIWFILRMVRWMIGGRVKIIVIIMFGMLLMLNSIMIGIRQMNVGVVCMVFNSGWMIFVVCGLCVSQIFSGKLIIMQNSRVVRISVRVIMVCDYVLMVLMVISDIRVVIFMLRLEICQVISVKMIIVIGVGIFNSSCWKVLRMQLIGMWIFWNSGWKCSMIQLMVWVIQLLSGIRVLWNGFMILNCFGCGVGVLCSQLVLLLLVGVVVEVLFQVLVVCVVLLVDGVLFYGLV